jgi:hypothetical protein
MNNKWNPDLAHERRQTADCTREADDSSTTSTRLLEDSFQSGPVARSQSKSTPVRYLLPLLNADDYGTREKTVTQLSTSPITALPELVECYLLPGLSVHQRDALRRCVESIIARDCDRLENGQGHADAQELTRRQLLLDESAALCSQMRILMKQENAFGDALSHWKNQAERGQIFLAGEYLARGELLPASKIFEQLQGSSLTVDDFRAMRPVPFMQILILLADPEHDLHSVAESALEDAMFTYTQVLTERSKIEADAITKATDHIERWIAINKANLDSPAAFVIEQYIDRLRSTEAKRVDGLNMSLIGDAIQAGDDNLAKSLILQALDFRQTHPAWDDDLRIAVVASNGVSDPEFMVKVRQYMQVTDATLNSSFRNLLWLAESAADSSPGPKRWLIEQALGEHVTRFVPPNMLR